MPHDPVNPVNPVNPVKKLAHASQTFTVSNTDCCRGLWHVGLRVYGRAWASVEFLGGPISARIFLHCWAEPLPDGVCSLSHFKGFTSCFSNLPFVVF